MAAESAENAKPFSAISARISSRPLRLRAFDFVLGRIFPKTRKALASSRLRRRAPANPPAKRGVAVYPLDYRRTLPHISHSFLLANGINQLEREIARSEEAVANQEDRIATVAVVYITKI